MGQPYRLLTLGLALCAVAAVVGAFILLNRSQTGLPQIVGKRSWKSEV